MSSSKRRFEHAEQLLRDGLVTPPAGFDQRVLGALQRRESVAARWYRWLSLAGACLGGCFGAAQVLRYVFGIWLATAAGG